MGDVVVSPIIRFDCIKWLKKRVVSRCHFQEGPPCDQNVCKSRDALQSECRAAPQDNTRPPKIVQSRGPGSSVVTTDFFGFDTSNNRFGLKGLGDVSEMGDAVLGLVIRQMKTPPRWIAVRNVSDPQIKAVGTPKEQATLAAQIYKGFGRWSTVCSAIVCWALIAAE